MKKSSLFRLVSILSFCFISCAPTKTTDSKVKKVPVYRESGRNVPDGWKEVKEDGVSFLIPSYWNRFKNLEFRDPSGLALSILKIEDSHLSLEEYVQLNVKGLDPDMKVVLFKEVHLNNDVAYLFGIKYQGTYMLMVVTAKNGKIYNLACGGSVDLIDVSMPVCQNILGSLQLK